MKNKDLQGKYNSVYKNGSSNFYTYNSFPESQLILDMLPRWNDLDVLEIGCGEGRLAAMLSFAGASHVDALDYSNEAINLARKSFDISNVNYICDDYKNLKKQYDVVVLQGVLEHLDNPFQDLSMIMDKVVNENGAIITSSPSFLNPRGYVWMTLQLLFDIPMSLTDLHFLCPFDFEEFAEKNNYSLQYESTDHDWGAGHRTIVDFEKRLINALKDAGMDNSKVEKFLQWLSQATHYYEPKEYSGATVAYMIGKTK